MGRLQSVTEAPTDPNYNYQTSYTYDALDNLRSVTQGAQTRSFAYDSLKRLRSATNPESGTLTYSYDPNGNLQTRTDARGVVTTYNYDALNRVTTRSYSNDPNQTPHVTYQYDGVNVPGGIANSKGQLTSVSTSGTFISSYSYDRFDAVGQVLQSTQTVEANPPAVMQYAYDLAGHLKSQVYPSGRVVMTEYDAAGRIAGVKNAMSGSYYAGAVGTDAANRIQYSAHGAVSAMKLGNGLWEHTNYNSRLQPTQIGLGTLSTNSSLWQLDYSYGMTDNNGNVRTQTLTLPGGLSLAQSYEYDAVNRLKLAQENNGSSWKQVYAYDQYGNRTFETGTTTQLL